MRNRIPFLFAALVSLGPASLLATTSCGSVSAVASDASADAAKMVPPGEGGAGNPNTGALADATDVQDSKGDVPLVPVECSEEEYAANDYTDAGDAEPVVLRVDGTLPHFLP